LKCGIIDFVIKEAMKEFLKQAFSDGGQPSSSRLLTIPHSVAAIFVLVYATLKNHSVPDATICGGLGAFATVHYLVNKAGSAVQSFSKQ
jgi:hypothetical protein